jgi:hypothetical protein
VRWMMWLAVPAKPYFAERLPGGALHDFGADGGRHGYIQRQADVLLLTSLLRLFLLT